MTRASSIPVLDGVFLVPGDGMIDFEPIALFPSTTTRRAGWSSRPSRTKRFAELQYAKKGYDCLAGLVKKVNG